MGNLATEEPVDRRAGGITAIIVGLSAIAVVLFLYIAVTLFGWGIGIAMTVLGLVIVELVALVRARGA